MPSPLTSLVELTGSGCPQLPDVKTGLLGELHGGGS